MCWLPPTQLASTWLAGEEAPPAVGEDCTEVRSRARGIWAVRRRLAWYRSRRVWKRLCRALRGNTESGVEESVYFWNTGGLRADVGIVREGWSAMDNEAKELRRASQRKMAWLRMQVETQQPTVVFLAEVYGTFTEIKKGLQLSFKNMDTTLCCYQAKGGVQGRRAGSPMVSSPRSGGNADPS